MKNFTLITLIFLSSVLKSNVIDSVYIKRVDSLLTCSYMQVDKGFYDISVENLLKAQVLTEKYQLPVKEVKVFLLLSNIFMLKKSYAKALDYAKLSLKKSQSIKDTSNIGWSYAKIADVMLETNKLDEAEKNYINSIEQFEMAGKKSQKGQMLSNLGLLLQKENRYSEAEQKFLEAYKISKEVNYVTFRVYVETELATLYRLMKKFDKAKQFFNIALEGEKEAGYKILTQSIYYEIHEFYKEVGDDKNSLMYLEKYSVLTDSLNKENQDQQTLETETLFRTKEKEKEIIILNKESELQQTQIKKKNLVLLMSLIILLSVCLLTFFIYKSRKKLSQKNIEIEHQKKEILDSINYAKRIQDASLGNPDKIKDIYSNSAIIFQPKDILSGDFYWFTKNEDEFMFSVADCTGHGVPGAMMSMVGNNGLNDAVFSNKKTNPADILSHLSEYVNRNFIKTDEDVKDGMDIAFCSLNIKTGLLKYAGALSSLYIRKNNGEFSEIKSDKNYIGQKGSVYTERLVQLEKGDCVYIMSDGFVDQFGGLKNKKFKLSGFRSLLDENSNLDIDTQNKNLSNAINDWKGNYEQTDDICMISVKF